MDIFSTRKALLSLCAVYGLMCSNAMAADAIIVGQVVPATGKEAKVGRAHAAGVQLAIDEINKTGGIKGVRIEVVRADDGSRPESTLSQTKQLIAKNRPVGLVGYMGSSALAESLSTEILQKERIALIGYRSSDVHPESSLIYSVRASWIEQLNKLLRHLSTLGIDRVGLLYEEGPQSISMQALVDGLAKELKTKIEVKVSAVDGKLDVGKAITSFQTASPQAIILVTNSALCASFMEAYRAAGGRAQVLTTAEVDAESITARLSPEQSAGIVIAQVVPNPFKISHKLTREFRDAAVRAKLESQISYAMLEGYVAAKVMGEALRRAGPKATRESLIKEIGNLGKIDLGDYPIEFVAGQRSISNFVELSIIGQNGRVNQ